MTSIKVINFMIKITPDLLTGNAQIDAEHGHLITLIAQLEEAEQQNDEKRVKVLFKEFLDYVTDHFVHEEFLMYQTNYPKDLAKEHKKSHRLLQEVYLVATSPVLQGQLPISRVTELFESNFIGHLLEWDKKLAEHLKSINYKSEIV